MKNKKITQSPSGFYWVINKFYQSFLPVINNIIMDSIVDSFLQEYSITDPGAKDSLIEVVNSCFKVYAQYMSKDLLGSEESKNPKEPKKNPKEPKEPKTPKNPKVAVLENPADATSLAQLGECTIQVLSKFCKEHSLKVGGKKDSVSLRVWRFLQGETSDEDRSAVKKSKEPNDSKDPVEPRECCGMTKSGAQCVLAGTKECGGLNYCFRHFPKDSLQSPEESGESGESEEYYSDPEKASSSSKNPKTAKESSKESSKTAKESSKNSKTPKTAKNPKNSKNPKVVELDSESE